MGGTRGGEEGSEVGRVGEGDMVLMDCRLRELFFLTLRPQQAGSSDTPLTEQPASSSAPTLVSSSPFC